MASTEIRWTTHAGDIAGVSVYSPTLDQPDRIRLTIGHDLHLYIPPAEARCIAMALIDAADETPTMRDHLDDVNDAIDAAEAARYAAPPAGLYHDPD